MADRSPQDRRRYRKIFTRLWRNPNFRALTADEKVLTLYILSGPQTNRIGLFLFSLGEAAEDLDVPVKTLQRRLGRVCAAFAWEFDAKARVLWLPSWWTFNDPKDNAKAFQGALSDMNDVPPTLLLHKFSRNLVGIPDALHGLLAPLREAIPDGIGDQLPDHIGARSQEQEQEQEQERELAAARTLLATWNGTVAGLPKCEVLSPDRLRAARARIREQPSFEWWSTAFRRMDASDFLTGRRPSKDHPNWRADIDWALKPGIAGKVLEGKYDNRATSQPAKSWAERRAERDRAKASGE